MAMSGTSMSSNVRTKIASKDLTNPATIHSNAWDGVAEGIAAELMLATHTLAPTSFNSGGNTTMPVDPTTINATTLKNNVKSAIAAVSTTPSGAHVAYWNAAGGAIVSTFAGTMKTKRSFSTSSPTSHTAVPGFTIGQTAAAAALASSIKSAIAGADKTNPATIHENMWKAVADTIITWLATYYVSVITPGGGGTGTNIFGTVT